MRRKCPNCGARLVPDEEAPEDPPAHQAHSETSRAAASSILNLGARQRLVLEYFARCGANGSTDEEGMLTLKTSPNGFRPRRVELQAKELLVDSGVTRPTIAKREAVVWKITEAGMKLVQEAVKA